MLCTRCLVDTEDKMYHDEVTSSSACLDIRFAGRIENTIFESNSIMHFIGVCHAHGHVLNTEFHVSINLGVWVVQSVY